MSHNVRIALLFPRTRVVAARAQREADRDADEAEGFAQAVDEIALVALGNAGDGVAEQDGRTAGAPRAG